MKNKRHRLVIRQESTKFQEFKNLGLSIFLATQRGTKGDTKKWKEKRKQASGGGGKASEEHKEREGRENLGFLFGIFRDLERNVWFFSYNRSFTRLLLTPHSVCFQRGFYSRRVWRFRARRCVWLFDVLLFHSSSWLLTQSKTPKKKIQKLKRYVVVWAHYIVYICSQSF